MSPRRLLLPALLSLLLAGLFWSFLAGRDAGSDRDGASGVGGRDAKTPRLAAGGKKKVRPTGGEAERDSDGWQAPPLKEGHGPVTITVLDWEGKPLPGALVELRPRGSGFTTLKTDADGKAAFPELSLQKRCDLVVHTWPFMDTRSYREMEWMPKDTTVTLGRALKITGQVVDEDGALATDFRVSYTLPGSDQVNDVLMQERGTFEISDLGPGTIRVWATHKEHKRRYLIGKPPAAAGPLDVAAGARDVVLQVVRGGILHLQLADVLIDERRGPLKATARAAGSGRTHRAEVDLDGHVVFLGLSPFDAYRVTVYGLGRSQYVDLPDVRPGKKAIRVQAREGKSIHGRYETPDGARLRKAEVFARHETLGVVRGLVNARTGRFEVEGLPPDTTWTLVVRGAVGEAGGEDITAQVTARAETGTELALSLR